MVPLKYNFNSTQVDMGGNMRYFACKMLKFAVEIKYLHEMSWGISTRWDKEFPRDMAFSQDGTFPWDMTLDLHT